MTRLFTTTLVDLPASVDFALPGIKDDINMYHSRNKYIMSFFVVFYLTFCFFPSKFNSRISI